MIIKSMIILTRKDNALQSRGNAPPIMLNISAIAQEIIFAKMNQSLIKTNEGGPRWIVTDTSQDQDLENMPYGNRNTLVSTCSHWMLIFQHARLKEASHLFLLYMLISANFQPMCTRPKSASNAKKKKIIFYSVHISVYQCGVTYCMELIESKPLFPL